MSIVVCVPWLKPHKKFLPHFIEWYALNKAKHDLHLCWQMYRPLHKAQAEGVKLARKLGASHIFFTEDDQWGFPVDGLEVLLEADKEVIGLHTYFKDHPYLPMNQRKIDRSISLIDCKENLGWFRQAGGPEIQETDLLTWAFTLVRMSVFDRLEQDPFAIWGEAPTDSYFCQYCEDVGIPRYVHFGGTVNHGDVPHELIPHYQNMFDSINASNNVFSKDAFTENATNRTYDANQAAQDMRLIEAEAPTPEELLCTFS